MKIDLSKLCEFCIKSCVRLRKIEKRDSDESGTKQCWQDIDSTYLAKAFFMTTSVSCVSDN